MYILVRKLRGCPEWYVAMSLVTQRHFPSQLISLQHITEVRQEGKGNNIYFINLGRTQHYHSQYHSTPPRVTYCQQSHTDRGALARAV